MSMPKTLYVADGDEIAEYAYTRADIEDKETLDVSEGDVCLAVYELKGYVVVRDVTKRTITKA